MLSAVESPVPAAATTPPPLPFDLECCLAYKSYPASGDDMRKSNFNFLGGCCSLQENVYFVILDVHDVETLALEMVQLFYYETRGKCCRKIINHEGVPTKVILFPYEGWAQPALTSYWLLKTYWWSRSRVKITEVIGTQKMELKGKIKDKGNGSIVVYGKLKAKVNCDFRMNLTSNVSNTDFDLGYCVTGTLERGNRNNEKGLNLTHYAMVKRRGY